MSSFSLAEIVSTFIGFVAFIVDRLSFTKMINAFLNTAKFIQVFPPSTFSLFHPFTFSPFHLTCPTMAHTLFQYWLESAIGLLLFLGIYALARRRSALGFRRGYLLVAPILALSIPLLHLEAPLPFQQAGLSSVWMQWRDWFTAQMGGYVQVNGLHLLSLVYFLATAVLLFRLADRLAASGEGLWKKLEMLVTGGGIALFWFQPVLHLFEKELKSIDRIPVRSASPAWMRGAVFFSLGAVALLSWLFAADQVCRWPLWYRMESRAVEWQERLEMPLFQLGSPRQEQALQGWAGYWTAMTPLQPDTLQRFPVRLLSPFELFSIYNQDWTWRKDGWPLAPLAVEALAVFPLQTDPVRLGSMTEIRDFLLSQRHTTEMTLFFRMQEPGGKWWLGATGVSEKDRLYGYKDILQAWGLDMPFLHWRKGQNGGHLAELVPHSPYSMVWGKLRLPLDLEANPNVYGAYRAFDLEEFREQIGGPILFYYNDSLLSPESVRITLWDKGRPANPFAGTHEVKMAGDSAFVDIGAGDFRAASTWNVYATLPDGALVNAVNLHIRDTDTPYDPPLRAMRLPRVDSLYWYQLVTLDQPPSLVRTDTSLARNRRIVDLYRSYDNYRIVHIPGFKTCDRLVQPSEDKMALLREEKLPLDSVFSCYYLPELPYSTMDSAAMEWGGLFAAPNSKVYSLEEFREQTLNPPRFRVAGGEALRLHSFVVYIFREDKPLAARWYAGEAIQHWDFGAISDWIAPRTSLFLEHITVEDSQGRLFSAPLAFAFHVGKSDRDIRWKVTVEKVPKQEAGEKEIVEEDQLLAFRNYPLSDLIAHLAMQSKNRMDFRGMDKDPLVTVQLSADGPLPARAREFMLDELQKAFRFEFSYERLQRPNWRLHLKDADLLDLSKYQGSAPPDENIRVMRWEGTHVLTGVTLNELAYHLEERFDEIVEWFPNAFINDRFSFSLNCASMAALQAQLEAEYGIVFQRMDTLWQGMVVRFY
jgi:hypothetical protein